MSVSVPPGASTGFPFDNGGAAFTIDRNRAIRLTCDPIDTGHADYLARSLARHPDDLIRHVQRINLHVLNAEQERLYGALVDLFIALGPRGASLRRRMLEQSRGILNRQQAADLDEVVKEGLNANHRLGDVPGSVLGRPVHGSLDLVSRTVSQAPARSTLEEAQDLLDEGQVDAARCLLERALTETPHDTPLAEELLLIYCATRDQTGYDATRILLERADALPTSWLRSNHSLETTQP